MGYFFLGHEYPNGGYIDGDVTFNPSLGVYYQVGAPLAKSDSYIVNVTMDQAVRKLKVDFFLTTSGAFFASTELAKVLAHFQPDLRTILAETRYASGKPTEMQYSLIHANDKIDAFDYQRSQYAGKELTLERIGRGESPDTFLIKDIRSVAIDAEHATHRHFFFLRNVLLLDPIVSDELAQTISDRKFNVCLSALTRDSEGSRRDF